MNILVIDAQGGGLGRQIVSAIKKTFPASSVTAVGTNSAATTAMKKAGADHAATGENAVIVCSRRADVIVGPIGIAIADSMYGEVTPAMAAAIGQSDAKRLLIPMSQCDNIILGTASLTIASAIDSILEYLRSWGA